MPAAFTVLYGAVVTVLACLAAGKLLNRALGLRLSRQEDHLVAFAAGAALVSHLVLAMAAVRMARKNVFLVAVVLLMWLAVRRGAHRGLKESLPPLGRRLGLLYGAVFIPFFILLFFNAMAPEASPDGSGYHLSVIGEYVRRHGLAPITENMYAQLPQGTEMLFLLAYSFGRHSAASLVHFCFLVALALGMLCYGRRFGFPKAGVLGSLLVFASPVAGVDATSAYNDMALACVLFFLFYLLEIWDQTRQHNLLVPVGLLAGFALAIKYTAFAAAPYALVFAGFKLERERKPWLRSALLVAGCAALMIAPWLIKNWIFAGNPLVPFFNSLFPNPYVTPAFEREYFHHMRNYGQLESARQFPLEVTVFGQRTAGLLGPVFLLAPLGLLALRFSRGRRLLAAAVLFGAPVILNSGTRFLLPALPFLSLAMGMAFAGSRGITALLAIAHGIASLPPATRAYSHPYAWRIHSVPVAAALRLRSEDAYLGSKMGEYGIVRMIERAVPPGKKTFSMGALPDAYTSREILVGYQSAGNNRLFQTLWAGMDRGFRPVESLVLSFSEQRARSLRLVGTAPCQPALWTIHELRLFVNGEELARAPEWRLRAHPNPWDVQLAFDGSDVTRWSSAQPVCPGMYVEIDFGKAEYLDSVRLERPEGQEGVEIEIRIRRENGEWRIVRAQHERIEIPPRPGLRRAAVEEFRSRGIEYLVVRETDPGEADFRERIKEWGIKQVAEGHGARIYRLD
ncbi:MAG: hypothetical protein FJW37_03635 [Acidobacteria bacterium]|nr:hypothetical protein [Acidobacteriota bacterium]